MLPDLFSFLEFVEREVVNYKPFFDVFFEIKFLGQKMIDDVLLLVVFERLKGIVGGARVYIRTPKAFGGVKDP